MATDGPSTDTPSSGTPSTDTPSPSTVPASTVSASTVSASTVSPSTLSIDVGGTGLKASVLDATGKMGQDRVRIPTPYPMPPEKLVTVLTDLVKPLAHYDRVSVGFPGMVRDGHVLSAPHFVSPDGPGGEPTPKLSKAWSDYFLQHHLAVALHSPCKVANDADLQGAAVVGGKGLELVLTLGTGLGSAFFKEGVLLPHLEFAHTPFRKHGTYNEAIGDAARKAIGHKKWQRRVADVIDTFRALCFFDHCYLGGGNSAKIDLDLPDDVTLVDNSAGILGGIKLWERSP